MTELNEEHEAAQPTPEWPETPAEDIGDPSVEAIAATLDGVRTRPVAEHEGIYGELHDALLESLNEDAPSGNGGA
jgi:hypothetical protein